MDELIRELQSLQQYAAGLHRLIADAEANSPRQAEGTDSTGTVHVELGPDGIPKAFRVDRDFENAVRPEAFGAAVENAFQAAIAERMSAWSVTLQSDNWQAKVDSVDLAGGQPEIPVAVPPPPARTRGLAEVSEEMIKAIDNAGQAQPMPPNAEGKNGGLVLTLSKTGAFSCTADPSWVSRQTASKMMTALGAALAEAKAGLSAAVEQANPLDRLLGEAFALLNDPERTRPSV